MLKQNTKRAPQNRTAPITLLVTPEQKERWLAAANRDQRKLADWIRLVIDRSFD